MAGPARLIERAIDEHDRVDVLVSSVGAVRLRLEGFSDDQFERAAQMNFFAAARGRRSPPAARWWITARGNRQHRLG